MKQIKGFVDPHRAGDLMHLARKQAGIEEGPEPGDEEHHLGGDEQDHAVTVMDLHHAGMNRNLAKYEQATGEEAPLGLILCAGKSTEHVELLQLEKSGIRVAEYLLEVPPPDVLRAKLHQMIHRAQERLAV